MNRNRARRSFVDEAHSWVASAAVVWVLFLALFVGLVLVNLVVNLIGS